MIDNKKKKLLCPLGQYIQGDKFEYQDPKFVKISRILKDTDLHWRKICHIFYHQSRSPFKLDERILIRNHIWEIAIFQHGITLDDWRLTDVQRICKTKSINMRKKLATLLWAKLSKKFTIFWKAPEFRLNTCQDCSATSCNPNILVSEKPFSWITHKPPARNQASVIPA